MAAGEAAPWLMFVVLLARRRTSGQPRAARMRALSLLLRRAAVAGPSVPAETSALGSRAVARAFFPTRTDAHPLAHSSGPPHRVLPPRGHRGT